MESKKSKKQTINRVPVTTRVFKSLHRRVSEYVAKTIHTENKLTVADVVNAGLITVIGKQPEEILHIVKSYRSE